MVFSVSVSGIIKSTREAFASRFAVKCDSEKQALEAVEGGLDWADANNYLAKVDGPLDEAVFPSLAIGDACRI
jgi:hypothetical protein